MQAPITFRVMTEADLPLIHAWLTRPHVAEWWQPTPSFEELVEEYGPLLVPAETRPLDAPGGLVAYLACEGDQPFAFVQAYRVMAAQDEGWWPDETDPCALGTDQFIGPADRLGQGLGTRMLEAFIGFLFADPRVTSIQTDPAPDNGRAIAAYRKAGFRDVGLVETPDGPEWLLRITRAEALA